MSDCNGNSASGDSLRQSPVVTACVHCAGPNPIICNRCYGMVAYAQPFAQRFSPWQPVGTAPLDRYVLVRFDRFDCCNVVRLNRDGQWLDEDGSSYAKPDWWMELPPSPLQATSPAISKS